MNKQSKYSFITDDLKDKILNGVYPPGTRLPGQTSLSKEYGVSLITSNRALNELRKLGLATRRERVGTFVLEKPQLPKEIIIVHYHLPEQSGLMIEEYWRGICARANEFNIPWKLEQISPSFYKKISDACFKDKGIILLGNEIKECVDLLRKNKIPCVLAGREANICKLCVTENRKDASWDLTKRLIDSGCKKIAFVGHFVSYNHQLARDGYVGALKESGYDYKFIVDTKVESVLHDIKSLINREPLLDGIVIIGAELCMKSLPVLLENQRNLKIGMFTENNLITQLKDTVYLAYYSQYEVGRLSVDLLKNAAEGKINCKTIQYAPYKILSPA